MSRSIRLLLDAHLPPAVATQLRRGGIEATALRDWMDGIHLHAPDAQILIAAFAAQRILVTYDTRTIPPMLKRWAATGQHHAGVVFVDQRTLRSDDIGGLVRALRVLVARDGDTDWLDRIVHLKATQAPQ